jgi:uncharacterized membrane protein
MKPEDLFTKEQKNAITEAIKNAELNTSGEIRVHIEKRCKSDVLDRAAYLFKKLKMHKTELRNGVLFYLAVKDRKFAIIGDVGINTKVPEGFWDEIKETMRSYFKEEKFAEGLETGITMAGEKLKEHFPYQSDDVNELSNDISYGKE